MTIHRQLLMLLAVGLMTITLAACGDTWEGFKQDTGENIEATGEAVDEGGEAIQN